MNGTQRVTPPEAPASPDTPAKPRAPLAALFRTGTVRLRAAAVTRSVEEGRSAYWRFNGDAFTALAEQVLADTSDPPAPSDTDPWSLLGPLADQWWAATADQAPIERWRAAADLAWLLAWVDSQAAEAWTYDDPGVDRLALPVERQASADLFAMLDRFTAPDSTAARSAATPPLAEDPATPSDAYGTEASAPATPAATSSVPAMPGPAPTAPGAKARWRGRQALAVATLRAFEAGVFSSRPAEPYRADARALQQLDAVALKAALRATAAQPLPGLDARAEGLAAWGRVLAERANRGGSDRLCSWAEPWLGSPETTVAAPQLAVATAALLAPGATRSPRVLGQHAGDVWPHLWAGAAADVDSGDTTGGGPTSGSSAEHRGTGGFVAFNRGAQQVVRTAAHPWALARAAGAPLPELTGLDSLPDRSSSADIDAVLRAAVLVPRHAGDLRAAQALDSAWVVEARAVALTVVERLVDRAAQTGVARPTALARIAAALRTAGEASATSSATGAGALSTPIVRYDTGLW